LAGTRQRQLRATQNDQAAVHSVVEFRQAMMHALRTDLTRKPVIDSWQELERYLRADMAYLPVEKIRVLYLNTQQRLIHDELAASGTLDRAPVYIREIIARALQLGAAGLILVHNHPSGDPQPSQPDLFLTRQLQQAAKTCGLEVHDHIVVSLTGSTSMRAMRLI
jgi:DNA repair protein RadC